MPETLTIIYLFYMFISLYFVSLFALIFLQNKNEMFFVPPIKKKYSLSILIPAFNEQDSIRGTVESVLNSDYDGLTEVIIINDGSSDKTLEIARELERKYEKVTVLDKKN